MHSTFKEYEEKVEQFVADGLNLWLSPFIDEPYNEVTMYLMEISVNMFLEILKKDLKWWTMAK